MNFQTAAIAGGVAFLLSLVAGLLGGVPFFDIVVRALIWAAVGFGACLGVEALLRSLIPDLFVVAVDEEPATRESAPERTVDITLEDEGTYGGDGFIEEVDVDAPPVVRSRPVETVSTPKAEPSAVEEPEAASDSEEMPEIGSFLDAFKPNAPDEGEGGESPAPVPEYGDYAPSDSGPSTRAGSVEIDGVAEDPAILARAVQTVMKRGQGN